jgi:hypothetical protein
MRNSHPCGMPRLILKGHKKGGNAVNEDKEKNLELRI